MGSIRARSDNGKLFFEFRYQGKRCREQTTLQDTPANRRQMEVVLKKIDAAITLGQFNYLEFFPNSAKGRKLAQQPLHIPVHGVQRVQQPNADLPTFSDFAAKWLAENRVRWRKATYESQTGLLKKHIIPYFGDHVVSGISRADLLGFRAHLATLPGPGSRESLSAKTINEIMGTVQAILNEAADRFGFDRATQGIQRLKVRKVDIKPFSIDQVMKIIESVREDYRQYMVVRFFTGMRSGELHGLKWKHVDFDRRQILIRETFSKGRTEYTKTDGSQREILVSDMVFDALKIQYEATGSFSEYVFCNRYGRPIDNKNFTDRVWYPLLRYLGLEVRRPYQTRHTSATLWLASGENPEWIARQMGHTTTEMLFRVYSRFVPNLTRNDGSAFDQLLRRQLTGEAPTSCAEREDLE